MFSESRNKKKENLENTFFWFTKKCLRKYVVWTFLDNLTEVSVHLLRSNYGGTFNELLLYDIDTCWEVFIFENDRKGSGKCLYLDMIAMEVSVFGNDQ